jgi:hypothetical protein
MARILERTYDTEIFDDGFIDDGVRGQSCQLATDAPLRRRSAASIASSAASS